jgi:hypothetical protein
MRKLRIAAVINKYMADGISGNNTRLHFEISTVTISERHEILKLKHQPKYMVDHILRLL